MANVLDNQEDTCDLLLGIPDEVWESIIKKFTRMDALNFRLVNRKSKFLVDDLYDSFAINLDERYEENQEIGPYLETLLNFRVNEVRVISLVKPLTFRPVAFIFKYPDLIKTFRMERDSERDWIDQISPEYLQIFLKSKVLENLQLTLVESVVNSLYFSSHPPQIGYDFSNLQTLTLQFHQYDKFSKINLIDANLFNRIMRRSIFSCLKSLNISILIWQMESRYVGNQMCLDVLHFLADENDRSKSLENLTCFIGGNYSQDALLNFPETADSLKESNFCTQVKKINFNSDFFKATWATFLEKQMNLVDLNSVFFPILSRILKSVVANNFETLTSIMIFNLKIRDLVLGRLQFDFSVFQHCHNLKNLHLKTCCNMNEIPEGSNLFRLPIQIEELCLAFLIHSEDLVQFSCNREKLKKLSLVGAGNLGDFGICALAMENLLKLKELSEISLFGSINMTISDENSKKFQELFDAMGCNLNPVAVSLTRNAVTCLWNEY